MVTHDTPNDNLAQAGLVTLTPIAKMIPSLPGACQQHLMHVLQGLGNIGEQF